MPQVSLFVRVHRPIERLLTQMLDSLGAQEHPDWQLHLLVSNHPLASADVDVALRCAHNRPRVLLRLVPDDELPAWTCNTLLEELGDWVGFLGQHDTLAPDALARLLAAGAAQPAARVVYSDEHHRNPAGRTSLHHIKGALDPVRLRTQDYLGGLALIQGAQLRALGGFDRLASDQPQHALYLRLLELGGVDAFVNVPAPLLSHYRTYLEPAATDPRRLLHLCPYDLHGIREHLRRQGLAAQVRQLDGTVRIHYRHPIRPPVTAWLVVGDNATTGIARIHAFNRTHAYSNLSTVLLHQGSHAGAELDYRMLAQALGYRYERRPGPLPATCNDLLKRGTADWVLLLQGTPINHGWLGQLVDQAVLPGVGAVAPRLLEGRYLAAPGVLGYRYAGWDWNTRGRFNRLSVPHQTGALGPAALLVNARLARQLGGFNDQLPSLYGMDLSLRLDAAGYALVQTPDAQVGVVTPPAPAQDEQDTFVTAWAGWQDRFGLHQSL